MEEQGKRKSLILGIMLVLGVWLALLLMVASWFQQNYIQSFTALQPNFLQADFTDNWFQQQLNPLLPPKSSQIRVIQFWQPNCLCNRFARTHALKTSQAAKALNIEHLTIIPQSYFDQKSSDNLTLTQLQTLNPNTRIISLDSKLLNTWPSSPSVFVEGALSQLHYFGPLGYGAFCSQASTGIIEAQLNKLSQAHRPSTRQTGFYNVIGKGCFCQWQ